MEKSEFKNVLEKSMSLIDVGISMGYFDENDRDRLITILSELEKNGIEDDIPGEAIYGMYLPEEKKLRFNSKVFKNEFEALTYVLHEMKHGLDHNGPFIGFENGHNFVGMNEGATQRFATDVAAGMLNITVDKKEQISLGIKLESDLDEYQIEDKINEMFCKAMGISKEEFFIIQNSTDKSRFLNLINGFNKTANAVRFFYALDELYILQQSLWVDKNGNLLEKEMQPTEEQIERAKKLINICQEEILMCSVHTDSYDSIVDDFIIDMPVDLEEMDEAGTIAQYRYLKYQDEVVKKAISNGILDENAIIIFVSDYGYDDQKFNRKIFYRDGNQYMEVVIPMLDDLILDFGNARVTKIDESDTKKIIEEIYDPETEFKIYGNMEEYASLLEKNGDKKKAASIMVKWKSYLKHCEHIDDLLEEREIRIHSSGGDSDFIDSIDFDSSESPAPNDELNIMLDDSNSISYNGITMYGNYIFDEEGTIILIDNSSANKYVSTILQAISSGKLQLNSKQQEILDNYIAYTNYSGNSK